MPLDGLHHRIASIALRVAARHGFALGGGNALIAHGVISRLTQDVDLVTNRETGVQAAAGPVEAALRREGFTARRKERASELAEIFPGLGDELADLRVTAPGGRRTDLQLAYFDRSREPVTMDVGPVLHLEDAAGNKVCALAGRDQPRDYVDTAALLGRWTPGELIGFAHRLDPGLDGRDLADPAVRLDRMPDHAFTRLGLSRDSVVMLRERFAAWPRDAREVSRDQERSRDIRSSAAIRHEREEPSHTRGQSRDLQDGQAERPSPVRDEEQAVRTPYRQRSASRERSRDDDLEIGR
jgi:hypothetical protein